MIVYSRVDQHEELIIENYLREKVIANRELITQRLLRIGLD